MKLFFSILFFFNLFANSVTPPQSSVSIGTISKASNTSIRTTYTVTTGYLDEAISAQWKLNSGSYVNFSSSDFQKMKSGQSVTISSSLLKNGTNTLYVRVRYFQEDIGGGFDLRTPGTNNRKGIIYKYASKSFSHSITQNATISISGTPTSARRTATSLTFSGTSVYRYKYRIKGSSGSWGGYTSEYAYSGAKSYSIPVESNKTYTQYVQFAARNSAGTWTYKTVSWSVDTQAPSTPSFSSSSITWVNSGSRNTGDAQTIDISYSRPSGATYVKVLRVSGSGVTSSGNLTATSGKYRDTGVYDSQTISYKIRAYDAVGNYKDSATGSKSISDRTAPSAPSFSSSSITWVNSGSRNTRDAQTIDVSYARPSGANYVKVFAVSGSGVSSSGNLTATSGKFRDTGVYDSQTISYKIRAYDNSGNYRDSGTASKSISDRTPPASVSGVSVSPSTSMTSSTTRRFTFSTGMTSTNYQAQYKSGSSTGGWTNISKSTRYEYEPELRRQIPVGYNWTYTATRTQAGSQTVYIRAVDPAGNYSSNYSHSWSIDAGAPVGSISYNITSATRSNVVATLTANEPITVTNNGGSTTYTFTSNKSFTFQFKDNAGNTASKTATVNWIDKTAPTISPSGISSPRRTNTTLTLSNADIYQYKYRTKVNSGAWSGWSSTYTRSSKPSFSVNVSGNSHYTQYVEISARDAVGNWGNKTVSWVVDTKAPTVPSVSISPSTSVTNSNTRSFSFNTALITDNYQARYISGSNTSSWANMTRTTRYEYDPEMKKNFPIGYTFSYTATKVNTGSQRVEIRGYDNVGNYSSAWSHSWSIDNGAPVGTISYSPSSATNQNVVATLSANEAITVTNNGGSKTYTFTSNGSFTFQFKDNAGNTASKTATVNWIDKTPPTIAPGGITNPTNTPNTLTLSNADIYQYKYRTKINNGTWGAWSTTYTRSSNPSFTIGANANSTYTQHVEISARDAVGNWGENPFNWTVDTKAPVIPTVNVSPNTSPTTNATRVFTFSTGLTSDNYQAKYTSGSSVGNWVNMTKTVRSEYDPESKRNIPVGHNWSYTATRTQSGNQKVEIRGIDNIGNTSPSPYKHEWVSGAGANNMTFSGQPTETTRSNVSITVGNVYEYRYRVWKNSETKPAWPSSYTRTTSDNKIDISVVDNSEYVQHLEVEGRDEVGNTTTTPPHFQWNVDTKKPTARNLSRAPSSLITKDVNRKFSFGGISQTSKVDVTLFKLRFYSAGTLVTDWASPTEKVHTESEPGFEMTYYEYYWNLTSTTNGEQKVEFKEKDSAGNWSDIREYTWTLDRTAPVGTLAYNPTTETSGPVTATLSLNEEGTITKPADGANTYVFSSNGSYTFEFKDVAGNTGTKVATVDWINTNGLPTVPNMDIYPTTAVTAGKTREFKFYLHKYDQRTFKYRYLDGETWTSWANFPRTDSNHVEYDHESKKNLTTHVGYKYRLYISSKNPGNQKIEVKPYKGTTVGNTWEHAWIYDLTPTVGPTISVEGIVSPTHAPTTLVLTNPDIYKYQYRTKTNSTSWGSWSSEYTYKTQNRFVIDELVSNSRYTKYVEIKARDIAGNYTHKTVNWIVDTRKSNYNYISSVALNSPITSRSQISGLSHSQKDESIVYSDQSGRAIQEIRIAASTSNKDIVRPVVYDAYGRQSKTYIPYVESGSGGYLRADAVSKVMNYYKGTGYSTTKHHALTNHPFAVTKFENSSANRPVEQGSIGTAWQPNASNLNGKTVKQKTRANYANEVRRWNIDGTINGYYPAGTLDVIEIKDEHGNTRLEYMDHQKHIVLRTAQLSSSDKRHTYYIYNHHGFITHIIPPMAVKDLEGNNWSLTTTIKNKWVTSFTYDAENRVIEKYTPEAGKVSSVYDRLGRVVLTQDAKLKSQNRFMYNKYDRFGNTAFSGILVSSNTLSTIRAAFANHTVLFETKTQTGNIGYTLNNSYPAGYTVTEPSIVSITYYNDYDNPVTRSLNIPTKTFTNTHSGVTNQKAFTRLFGEITASKVRVLPDGDLLSETTPKFLSSYDVFDEYNRIFYTEKENTVGGKDYSYKKFDWAGRVIKEASYHYASGQSTTENYVISEPVYDQQNRVVYVKTSQKFKDVTKTYIPTLAKYNELGNEYETLINPSESSITQASGAYNATSYTLKNSTKENERGWLTELVTASASKTFFKEELAYNTHSLLSNSTGFVAKYDGTITGVEFEQRDASDNIKKYQYIYGYDNLGQLKKAAYFAHQNAGARDDYTTDLLDYDANGNIKALRRKQKTSYIDNLSYTYNGNKIQKITDSGSATLGFKDGANVATEYVYDVNGNLTEDKNKGIQSITYNFLNLPKKITLTNGQEIHNKWGADGSRISRIKKASNGTIVDRYEYVNGYVYENNSLHYTSTNFGRFVDNNGIKEFEYFTKDHLGNTRQSLRENNGSIEVVQDNHYYAFGMRFIGLSAETTNTNRITFNGKEVDKDLNWYHYGARFYDPETARWWSPDKADEFNSRYMFGPNDPINGVDPDGNIWGLISKAVKVGKALYKGGSAADAFAGIIEDVSTLVDPNASVTDKLIAAVSLASEVVSPVSVKDVKHGVDAVSGMAKKAENVADSKVTKATKTNGCFVPGTLVHTETGFKNIEDVKVGEKLYTYNEVTDKVELKPVEKLNIREVDVLLTLTLSNQTIITTVEHPFYIVGKGWVDAEDLNPGDLLSTSKLNGGLGTALDPSVEVVKVEKSLKTTTVYNFNVKDNPNYFVADLNILVHNGCGEKLPQKIQGEAGEAKVRARLAKNPNITVQEQVRVRTPGEGSFRVTDFLVTNKKTGKKYIIEVKTGNATRDKTQLAKDKMIADPNANTTFFGRRSGDLKGQPTGGIRTFEVNADNLKD